MKFWNYKFQNKIYNVNYELLVSDHESEIKKIIKYIGLNWENNCLFPEKNNTGNILLILLVKKE